MKWNHRSVKGGVNQLPAT